MSRLKAKDMSKCIGCYTCMLVCAGVNRKKHSISDSAIKVRTNGGLKGNFVADVCIACTGDRACMEVCPSGSLTTRDGGGVIFNAEHCIGCGKCKDACIVNGIHWDKEDNNPLICKHCGVCAKFCPHDCLVIEKEGK